MRAVLLLSIAGLVFSTPLLAHDFWIQARPFVVTEGEDIEISLLTGDNLVGKSLPNRLDQYIDFSYSYDDRRIDVPGEMGRDPAGVIRRYNPGGFTVGYQSVSNQVKLRQKTFVNYLREEGLEQYGEQLTRQIVVEQYTRYAKALVGSASNTSLQQLQTDFDYRLELHSLNDPYRLGTGELLRFRLTSAQQPAADIRVTALCKGDSGNQQRQRSNAAGEVSFKSDCRGLWLVKAVQMLPSNKPGVDFESFWASLTFVRE